MSAEASDSRPYVLYGAEVSYFTGKVRPAFRAKRVFTEERLSTIEAYREVILPRTGMAFIPIVVTPEDEVWQDTSEILDALEDRFPERPLFPPTPVQRVVAGLWEVYADEFMVLPAMHYRWSFAESEAKARGDFAAMNGDAERANAFADRMSGALGMLGITEKSAEAIEAHTAALLECLENHFAEHRFLLGARPSLADCALMGPVYAHLYQDAVPGRLLRETAPRTCHWVERMNHPDTDGFGDWLAEDALAETMRPLLELIGQDAVPVVLAAAEAADAWADAAPTDTDELPRIVGSHESRLRGAPLTRGTGPYTVWMLQRPLDAFHALEAPERARVVKALAGTGCEDWLGFAPRHRVGKRNRRLVFEGRQS